MDNIIISKMTMLDLESINDCLFSDFDDFWSINTLKSELQNPNSEYIVAKINNNIVGFAGIWKAVDDVHITNIVTAKKYRRQKIGSTLLSNLIEMAKNKENITSITLEVNSTNIPAQKLYNKFHFKIVGIRKKYYNNKDDAIIMTLKMRDMSQFMGNAHEWGLFLKHKEEKYIWREKKTNEEKWVKLQRFKEYL